MATPERYLFIIGGMKCGTTSLFNYLGRHPRICPSRIKESGFFAFADALELGMDWYHGLWDWDPARHVYAMEASTFYTKLPAVPDVPETIAAHIGDRGRFIYQVRHPLRRIESQVRHGVFGHDHIRPEVLHAAEPPAVTPEQSLDHGLCRHLVDFSRYAYQLDPFVQRFGRDRVLVIALEQLLADPAATVARVCRFLELPADEIAIDTGKVFNRGHHGVDSQIWKNLNNIEPIRRLYTAALPESVRRAVRKALNDTSHEKLRLELTDAESRRLLDELRPDLARLQSDYGIDVAGLWGIEL